MFQNVLLYARTAESEGSHVAFTEEFTSRCTEDSKIPGVPEIQSICTQYAADLIVSQLKLARTTEYTVQVVSESDKAVISYQDRSHSVSVKGTCSCTFQKTLLMPCRHVFKYRIHCGLTVFDPSLVADRWLKQFQIHVGKSTDDLCNNSEQSMNEVQLTSISSASYLNRTLARNQKYRKIRSLTDKLAVIASQCGMPQFRQKYSTIETLVHMWEDNISYALVPVADSSSSPKDVKVTVS